MAGMLKMLKIELVGHHHSGIDDCRNIGRVCVRMLEDGRKKRGGGEGDDEMIVVGVSDGDREVIKVTTYAD